MVYEQHFMLGTLLTGVGSLPPWIMSWCCIMFIAFLSVNRFCDMVVVL